MLLSSLNIRNFWSKN